MSRLDNTVKELKSREIDVLKSIYDYRCLTPNQMYLLHYQINEKTGNIVSDSYCKTRIRAMKQMGVLRIEKYLDEEVLFLTNHGIEVLRYFKKLPTNVYDEKTQSVKKGYHSAKDLEFQLKFFNHQINLNDFVINFSLQNSELNYKYLDEKDVSQYVGIRPDGLLSIGDTDIFLEMDMSTESKKQLDEKWAGYREFLRSSEYQLRERRIVMLFIIEGKLKDQDKERAEILSKIEERKKIVKNRIHDNLFDMISTEFDIYIGSQEEMLELLNKKLVPEITQSSYPRIRKIANIINGKHQFLFRNYNQHFSKIDSPLTKHQFFDFNAYIYKYELYKERPVFKKDSQNRNMEFIIDDYMYEPVSVGLKIFYFRRYLTLFKENHNRTIRYIIIAESLEKIYADLKLYNVLGDLNNIYFTTLERLENMPFYESICYISPIGSVYHFLDENLKEMKIEKNLRNVE